jgi:thymidylate synthase
LVDKLNIKCQMVFRLLENNCNIWTGDCYKRYCEIAGAAEEPDYDIHVDDPKQNKTRLLTKEEFTSKLKTDDEFAKKWGELGKIYGHGWRNWNGKSDDEFNDEFNNKGIDQISDLIKQLKENPDSRRLLVSAWNPSDLPHQVLPPCHYGFQVYTRELSLEERLCIADKFNPLIREDCLTKTHHPDEIEELKLLYRHEFLDSLGPNVVPQRRAISLMFNMRSNDVPLGLPFNIASYALLLEIIGKMVDMVPNELIVNIGDAHIYENQIAGIKEQLTRESYELPKLVHMKTDDFYKSLSEDFSLITHLSPSDFQVEGYKSHSPIKIPLSN